MVIDYHNKTIDVMNICTYIGSCTRGVGEDEINKAAVHYGFSKASWNSEVGNLTAAIMKRFAAIVHIHVLANKYPMIQGGQPAYTSYTGGHYIQCHGMHCNTKGEIDYLVCNDPGKRTYNDVKYTWSNMKHAWGASNYRMMTLH
eukprot:JZ552376.1.p1 GENE.JZ552376.1~~JZ552376.1.p1  ORF type:complete len:144 (+),score=3.66 JZ552376.1:157-588(+)